MPSVIVERNIALQRRQIFGKKKTYKNFSKVKEIADSVGDTLTGDPRDRSVRGRSVTKRRRVFYS
jgi:hypothetical protein